MEGFIARELFRIQTAIGKAQEAKDQELFGKLMIAQQSLVWALDPHSCYASPYAMVTGEKDAPIVPWPQHIDGPPASVAA